MDQHKLISSLEIPSEFDLPDFEVTNEVQTELDFWKDVSLASLRQLLSTSLATPSTENAASLIFAVSPFWAYNESWSSSMHFSVAKGK
jgi:hypothetical protein